MDFWNFTTLREACKRSGVIRDTTDFYSACLEDTVVRQSGQAYTQFYNEREWERARRPYYSVWPSIVPMLTRLNLDLNSALIRLPLPTICIRLPKDKNPLTFEWEHERFQIRCMLLGEINKGEGISILIDVGETVSEITHGTKWDYIKVPIYTYRNFRRQEGLTVEKSLQGLKSKDAELGIQIPKDLITDCMRLCCSLCLLEDDPSVIEPDVLNRDQSKFSDTHDPKYIKKAHRRGKVGWSVGRQVEVIPHYRRPHMTLVWTGRGRLVPKIVPRRGSIIHRRVVEKIPSGFGK